MFSKCYNYIYVLFNHKIFLICIVKCFEIFVMPEREKQFFFHQILAGRNELKIFFGYQNEFSLKNFYFREKNVVTPEWAASEWSNMMKTRIKFHQYIVLIENFEFWKSIEWIYYENCLFEKEKKSWNGLKDAPTCTRNPFKPDRIKSVYHQTQQTTKTNKFSLRFHLSTSDGYHKTNKLKSNKKEIRFVPHSLQKKEPKFLLSRPLHRKHQMI